MLSDYHFTATNKNGDLLNFTVHINPDEIKTDKDCDLLIRRVIADAFKAVEELSQRSIQINITGLDIAEDSVKYQIIGEPSNQIHEIAFRQFEKKKVSKEISKKQIISADAAAGEVGELSLLERFAVVDHKPKGFFGKVFRVLSAFFSKLLYPFVLLQRLWQSLTGKAENTLPWDINLLAEICGTQPLEPMSMMHSLRYMSTMLDREKGETADPVLQYRFKNALALAQEIDQTRQNYKEKSAKKIVNSLQKSLAEIDRDQKILVPVGFMNNGKLNEALLEVTKDPNGSYRVAFISALEEMRDLFDYEMDVKGGSRSLRREITHVSLKDLQAAIPTLIELQTTPNCIEIADDSAWKNIFLQTLRFENSTVELSPTKEQYLQQSFPGHLSEAISYVKDEQRRPEDAKRFELAIRLQLFLDVCKANKGGLKDSQFWTSVRTTARFLATEIEQNKSLIGSKTQQGKELTRVYGELRQLLDGLDRSLPKLESLQNKELPLANGIVNIVNPKETPDLVSVNVPSTVYPKIDPAFALFDPQEPEKSIRNLGVRMRKLIEAGRTEEAAREAKLAVQVLPAINDLVWGNLTRDQSLSLLPFFTVIAEAIARGSVEKDQPSIQDLSTLTTVNFLAHTLAKKANLGTPQELACFTVNAHRHLDDLLNCHLPASEFKKLQIIKATVPVIEDPNWNLFRNEAFQPLYACARFTQKALESRLWKTQVKSTTPITFDVTTGYMGILDVKYTRPFALMAPKYAHDLSLEVTNRYVTEFCCFGCIRDNCPAYNTVDKDVQRFHPLYMLHNFVDIYTKNLTAKGKLKRDELTDLMYTQQTNQNAYDVYNEGHRGVDGFDVANAFDERDRQIQLMNTFMIYLDHPNFFKQPDLRWQFETKLFKFGTLERVLNAPNFSEQEPFFNSMLKKLSREISISNAAKDKETAAYLVHVCKEMQEAIISSNLPEEKKKALVAIMPKNLDQILNNWARELVSSNDEHQLANQMMVLPIMLENYYKKFLRNPLDPCFDSQKDLELILSAMNRIELRDRLKKIVEPELHDRYQSMMPFIFHKVQEKVAAEAVAGDFINKILMHLNPTISSLRLKWDPARFPTFTAVDSKGETYQFDLTTGVVSVKSKQTAEIPNDIKNDPTLKLLFGKTLNEVWGIKGNREKEEGKNTVDQELERFFGRKVVQDFFDNTKEKPQVPTERIISYTHDQFPNQRIVVRRPPLDAPAAPPQITIERMITDINGKEHWLTYTDFDVQQALRENRELPSTLDIPVNVALAIGNRTCWMDSNKENIYVFEIGYGSPYAVIKLKTEIYNVEPEIKEMGFAMKMLAKLTGNSGDEEAKTSKPAKEPVEVTRIEDFHLTQEDTHLLKASERDLEKYSTIEDPRFIQVFGKDNQPNELIFSRYELSSSGAPLTFDIGKERISSKAYPNYHLASYGFRPGLKNPILGATPLPPLFDGFLLLRKEGDEKVLVPLRGFEPEYTLEGAMLPTRKAVLPNGFDKCPLYEFSVDKETNRLVAKSGDAYAYLAYLCLAHGDYSSSAFYLSKARTTAGYDATYDQVFNWVEKWQDETPNGIAMKLRFEIFREKVLEDRHMQKIREGNLGEAEEVSIGQAPRFVQIAELYGQYTDLVNTPTHGEIGVDPSLELTNEDQRDVKKMVKALLAMHGGEQIETHEPKPVRAEEIPLLQYMNNPGQELLGLNSGVLKLWAFNGTDQNRGPFSLNNPLWIVQNFRDLFNRVIAADSHSLEYKQLSQQIRMAFEIPKDKLSPVEVGTINTAQAMLLKLITLKETDQIAYDNVINELGSDITLEKFKGPFFKISRMVALDRANNALEKFGISALNDYESMKEAAWNLWRKEGFDPLGLRKFGEQVMHKMSQWKEGANGKPLSENFRDYALSEFFTPGGAAILKTMNTVYNLLLPVKIRQATQTMQKPLPVMQPVASQPSLTYAEKYGKLLDAAPTDLPSKIEELQRNIAASAVPAPLAMVETDSAKVYAVMGDPLSKRLSKLFNIAVNPAPTIDQTVFDDLSRSDEKTFSRVAEKHRADLAAYLSAKTTVSIAKQEAEEVRAELVAERSRITTEEEALKKDLLQCVDLFDSPAGNLAMRRLIGQEAKPSLDFLISLWRRDELTKPWNENPLKKLGLKSMSEAALKKLDEDIGKYLELSTIHNHLNRVVDMADNYIKTCGSEYHSAGDVQLANELFEGVITKRNYALNSQDNADYRDLQYVEYTQKIIMYADQIATLREMTFDPNAVRQLRMGRGKTEVIMPLLAKKKATGKNLVVLMLPEELYEANCRGLDVKNRLLFGQEMHRFDFSLKTDKSVASLQQIQKRLLTTMHEKGFIMSTKRSLLSLKNSYLLLLNKLAKMGPNNDKSEITAQIRELNKIISLFYNHADVLADEVDACLDVRKEVNFALGEPERVDPVKGDVGADLMHLVIDQKPGDLLYELKDVLIHNTQAAIAPDRRKAILADLVRLYFDKHHVAFPSVDKEQFVSYILDDPAGAPVEAWVFGQKETNRPVFKQVAALKAFIDQGFGTTLGRLGNVNYGRDPITGVQTIPYKASNTASLNSEFDDDIERISFTYQDYIQNGVSYKQVYQIVARMQNQAIEQLRGSNSEELLSMLDTPAARDFEIFVQEVDPENKLGSSVTLANMNDPKKIEALTAALNSSTKGRVAFCHKQVVRNMQQFSAQINSMSTEAPQLVKNFSGFTGTPWNIHTYHDKIHAEANLGVDGMTWALLLGRPIDIKTFNFDADKPIESLLTNLDLVGNFQAVVDTGAYLRGTSNAQLIDQALDVAKDKKIPIQAGIYFDESGKIVKKVITDKQALPIETAPTTDLMQTITLYDQAHTVGADIKQGKKAKAVVTIGENTFIRDLFQAVWRMRQLNQEQDVAFAVSDKIKERILGQGKRDLTIVDILKFCLMNESRREAEDNFKAEKEKIQGAVKRAVLPEIVNVIQGNASDETIVQLAKKFATDDAQLFVKLRAGEEAYDSYARIKTKEPPLDAFERLKAKESAKSQRISEEFKALRKEHAAQQLNQLGKEIAKRPAPPESWFSNKVNSYEGAGGEVEQEAQAEVEQELELMLQTEMQTQTETVKEVNIPIVQSGEAGHGDVSPIRSWDLFQLIYRNSADPAQFRNLSKGLPYFDPQIYLSSVFERNLSDEPASPQSVFYSNRKPVKQVMIAKNSMNEMIMVIPTIHEAHAACKDYIAKEKTKQIVEVAISAGRPLVIYKTGDDRSDALPFKHKEDIDQFYRLYIQAKLFNGEIEFGSKEEQEALKQWLISKGTLEFKTFFEQNILAAKPRRFADAYPNSTLFKIFNDLLEVAKL